MARLAMNFCAVVLFLCQTCVHSIVAAPYAAVDPLHQRYQIEGIDQLNLNKHGASPAEYMMDIDPLAPEEGLFRAPDQQIKQMMTAEKRDSELNKEALDKLKALCCVTKGNATPACKTDYIRCPDSLMVVWLRLLKNPEYKHR